MLFTSSIIRDAEPEKNSVSMRTHSNENLNIFITSATESMHGNNVCAELVIYS